MQPGNQQQQVNPWQQFGSGIGDLATALFNRGGNYNNPADSAMPYLQQIGPMLSQYFSPYMNAGQNAMGVLQGQYGQLVNDPGAVMNKIGAGFQQSPGYQFNVNQAMNAANRAASAGGMLGSPMEQQQAATAVHGLADQDYYNYLNHGMNLYDTGLHGYEGLNQMGFNASSNLAQSLKDALESQAQTAYAGQADKNMYDNSQRAGMAGALGGAIGNIAGGMSGLPWGNIASKIANWI